MVQAKISAIQRENRSCQVTGNYLASIPAEAPVYRSLGKAFVQTPRPEIDERLNTETANNTKMERDLVNQKEFLDRRITSLYQQMRDIAAGV